LWLLAERYAPAWPLERHRVVRIIKTLLVFHGVCLLWVLFRAPTLEVAREYFARLLWPHEGTGTPGVLMNWLVMIAIAQWPLAWTFKERRFPELPFKRQWLLAAACVYFILAYAGARVDFIYFNF